MTSKLKLVFDAKAELGEGPCWDADNELLYWTDILGKSLHIHNPASGDNRTVPVGLMVGSFALGRSGGIVLAAESGFYSLDPETGKKELMCDPAEEKEGNRFNDGKCDPAGRFWAGSMPMAGAEPSGSLYCLETDRTLTRKLTGIGCSNGLAWSPDCRTMYYIDTPTRQVAAFRYDKETGDIDDGKVACVVPESDGFPDGMTIDEEGCLWIAHWGGGKVTRWNPSTGSKLDEIVVPADQVTSCAFGGVRMNELYVTTARAFQSEETLRRQPHAGGLFKIELNVTGAASSRFLGI